MMQLWYNLWRQIIGPPQVQRKWPAEPPRPAWRACTKGTVTYQRKRDYQVVAHHTPNPSDGIKHNTGANRKQFQITDCITRSHTQETSVFSWIWNQRPDPPACVNVTGATFRFCSVLSLTVAEAASVQNLPFRFLGLIKRVLYMLHFADKEKCPSTQHNWVDSVVVHSKPKWHSPHFFPAQPSLNDSIALLTSVWAALILRFGHRVGSIMNQKGLGLSQCPRWLNEGGWAAVLITYSHYTLPSS